MKAAMDLMKLMDRFGSDDRCRAYLEQLRWPDGPRCPKCQSTRVFPMGGSRPGVYDCAACGYQFTVTVGTVLQDTHLPLSKWLAAVYLMCESRKGISANQLKRTLNVSYKTAWHLCHRIRSAMHQATIMQLGGIVEVDETYIGGKKRGIGSGKYRDHKAVVVGAVQRGGNIMLRQIERANRRALHKFIRETIRPDAERIMTDDANAYKGVGDHDTTHEIINHREAWVRADVHTNTVEGVWSLFKRSLVGSYHQLSAKHLAAYLDEMAFRFNNRHNPYLFRDTVLRLLATEALPFRKLVDEREGA